MTDRILFIDTETTGLPKNRYSNGLESKDNWPNIVSVSWAVYQGQEKLYIKYALIKPDGWIIPEDSTKIHGITYEYALANGRDLYEVMIELHDDLLKCDVVVAHNLEFDKNVIFSAYKWHCKMNPWPFWPKEEICTMNRAESEVKIPSKYPKPGKLYKSPSLMELYRDTFKKEPSVALHNSQRDVEAMCEIFWARWP